jgi:hypothetical protein
MEELYAYTWFRRIQSRSPGNWEVCTATQMPNIVRYLRRRKALYPLEPGEVLRGRLIDSRHDFIYVQTPLPLELIEGLEEV